MVPVIIPCHIIHKRSPIVFTSFTSFAIVWCIAKEMLEAAEYVLDHLSLFTLCDEV